jgi:hypothetical protein
MRALTYYLVSTIDKIQFHISNIAKNRSISAVQRLSLLKPYQ